MQELYRKVTNWVKSKNLRKSERNSWKLEGFPKEKKSPQILYMQNLDKGCSDLCLRLFTSLGYQEPFQWKAHKTPWLPPRPNMCGPCAVHPVRGDWRPPTPPLPNLPTPPPPPHPSPISGCTLLTVDLDSPQAVSHWLALLSLALQVSQELWNTLSSLYSHSFEAVSGLFLEFLATGCSAILTLGQVKAFP